MDVPKLQRSSLFLIKKEFSELWIERRFFIKKNFTYKQFIRISSYQEFHGKRFEMFPFAEPNLDWF